MKRLTSLHRQWRLLTRLYGLRFGLSIRTLLEEFGISRGQLYRDIDVLKAVGFELESEMRNGEAYYKLLGKAMPSARPTARQAQALRLARRLLAPLEGTRIIRELDALLPGKVSSSSQTLAVEVPPQPSLGDPTATAEVERAMLESARIEFIYAPADGEPALRIVDPLALYVRDGHLYLDGYDVEKDGFRTFKIARMSAVRVLKDKAQPHPEYDERRVFAHTAKIWDGPLVDVAVRISPRGARFVNEWPLVPSQQLEHLPDGSVLVRAGVSGTIEAMRWVLRWGKEAEVLEPAALRSAVITELLRAIATYTGAVVSEG